MTHRPTAVVILSDISVVLTMSMGEAQQLEDVLSELPTDHPTDAIWAALDGAIAQADQILEEMQV